MINSMAATEDTPVLDGKKLPAYQPSRAARKLLEVLLNPEHRFKTKTEQCQLAKISRERFRQLLLDKDFMCHYTREAQRLVKGSQGAMVNALVKSAVRGNPQNLKVGLAMAGMYHDKIGLGVTVNPDADGNPQPVQLKGDMEIAVKVARLIHIMFSNPKVKAMILEKMRGMNGTEHGPGNTIDIGADAVSISPDAGAES